MDDDDRSRERGQEARRSFSGGGRVFVYRGALPPFLVLLVLAPLLLVFFSVAVVLLGGAALAAFVLPRLLRGKRIRRARDDDAIELSPQQYARVEDEPRRLPPG